MQLTKSLPKPPLRQVLMAATAVLVGTPGASQAEVTVIDKWKVDLGYLRYTEKNRIDVDETFTLFKRKIGEEDYLSVRLVHDAVSGASPTGVTPVQSTSAASGTAALVNFSTIRRALGIDWELSLSPTTRAKLSADYSTESGYQSQASGMTMFQDFNQRNTTMFVGVGYTLDTITPAGGIKEEMRCVCNAPVRTLNDSKRVFDGQVGITQILGRKTLAQWSYTLSDSSGYLTNPYKLISEVHPITGETLNLQPLTEKRPSERRNHILSMQLNHHLGGDVAYFSYRYFEDDWGIGSHTVDVRYRYQFNSNFYLQPHWRYYTQTQADFYRTTLVRNERPEYASADYRLADMHSTLLGIKTGYRIAENLELSAKLEYLTQAGDSHPNDVIGVQQEAEFFPRLTSYIIQFGFSAVF